MSAILLTARYKTILYVVLGIVLLAIGFGIYRVITRRKPPKAKKPNKNNWSPTPIANNLVNAYVGWSNSPLLPWTDPYARDYALNQLLALDSEQTVDVYNEFARIAFTKGHELSLTATIKDGSTVFVDDSLNAEVIGKLTSLNLP